MLPEPTDLNNAVPDTPDAAQPSIVHAEADQGLGDPPSVNGAEHGLVTPTADTTPPVWRDVDADHPCRLCRGVDECRWDEKGRRLACWRIKYVRGILQKGKTTSKTYLIVDLDTLDAWPEPIPFEHPDLPRFPADALPRWLRDLVDAVAEATQTPVDLAAMLTLAVLAVAVAKKVKVEIRAGYTEPVNVFVVVALPPANRKSAVFRVMAAPLLEFEQEELRRVAPLIAAAEEEKLAIESRLKRERKASEDGEAPADMEEIVELRVRLAAIEVPPRPRLLVDDVTTERLATLIAEQCGRMGLLSAEGGVFSNIGGRYSDRGEGYLDVYLKGHTGELLRVDRVSRSQDSVSEPALTLGLTVQPEVIRSLGERREFRGRGLLGRFLYSIPESLLGRRKTEPRPVPEEVGDLYHKNLKALAALPFPVDESGAPVTKPLALNRSAYKEWAKFSEEVEPRLAEDGDLHIIADWAGKLTGAVARIAGLLHMAKHAHSPTPWDTLIDQETMRGAIRIGRYLLAHAQQALPQMGADPTSEAAERVLRWIRREKKPCFSRRDLHQAHKGRFTKVSDLEPALRLLTDHGYIRLVPAAKSSKAGRPHGPEYDVNPHAFSEDEGAAPDAPPPVAPEPDGLDLDLVAGGDMFADLE